jgi:hypothetical protein
MRGVSPADLKALYGYLRQPEAEVARALRTAAHAERERRHVAYKYKPGVRRPGTYERLRARLADLVCNRRTGALKTWVQELVDGDLRDLAVAILVLVASQLSVAMSVAVPFAALVAKRGLRGICRRGGKRRPGSRTS